MVEPSDKTAGSRRETLVAALLVVCVAIVAFWLIMGSRSQGSAEAFALTPEHFADFNPAPAAWTVQRLPLPSEDPNELNIVALLLKSRPGAGDTFPDVAPILVRLVHGYNMVDCMRIKGEDAQLIGDTRADLDRLMSQAPGPKSASVSGPATGDLRPGTLPPGLQLWRLVSSTTRTAIWSTAMLRAGDFAPTATDTRSLPFPRADFPGNPNWSPQGLTWRSLRHPIRNTRMFLRDKWNASQSDLSTFLGLSRAARASDELLTLVAASTDPTVLPGREARTTAAVVAAHQAIQGELQAWAAEQHGDAPP